jgi:hypothetical protein
MAAPRNREAPEHERSFGWRERRVYYWGDVGNGLIRTRRGLAFALSRSEQNLEPVGEEETVYRAFDGFAPNFVARLSFRSSACGKRRR